jgi:hypothetical protein
VRHIADRGILWRTFPVMPRKRVKFDPETPVEFTLFQSNEVVFRCLGGFFTHNSYNLLDWFASYWLEIASRKWRDKFGEDYPKTFKGGQIDNLSKLTPISSSSREGFLGLRENFFEIAPHFEDYAFMPQIADSIMREHPSLKRLSSSKLSRVIDRTSRARIKTIYPVRVVDGRKGGRRFGWFYASNLGDSDPWSELFRYRLLDEKRGKDGRVTERVYRFGFTGLIGVLMIHNTICGAFWEVNPGLYGVSPDAQLLYRYLVVAGSRIGKNRLDFIGYRIARRERQEKRLTRALERILGELVDAGLLEGFEVTRGGRGRYFCSIDVARRKNRKEREKKWDAQDRS